MPSGGLVGRMDRRWTLVLLLGVSGLAAPAGAEGDYYEDALRLFEAREYESAII